MEFEETLKSHEQELEKSVQQNHILTEENNQLNSEQEGKLNEKENYIKDLEKVYETIHTIILETLLKSWSITPFQWDILLFRRFCPLGYYILYRYSKIGFI